MLTEAAAAFGAVNSFVQAVKTVAGAAKTASKSELQKQVEDLANQAGDVAFKLMELQAQNLQLATENSELKEKLKRQDEFEWRDNAMWRKNADGSNDGPYCAGCYQGKGQAVHLNKHGTRNKCPVCQEFDQPIVPTVFGPKRIVRG